MKIFKNTIWTAVGLFGLAALVAMPSAADQVILDDLIVDGSACIGFDCVNGESFGFDTLRLKENNLRIKAEDTSSTASFPTQDWQITFNDTSNGGANKFSIDAVSPSSSTPFTILSDARTNAIFVKSNKVGFGTNTPVSCLHCRDGNTPTLRLEQDGSSGFTAQTWDVAGNEANFFIRDATNGSTLPFRIEPGSPTNALYVNSGGEIGIGDSNPTAELTVTETAAGLNNIFRTNNNGTSTWISTDTAAAQSIIFNFVQSVPQFNLTNTANTNNFDFNFATGNLDIDGEIITASCAAPGGCGPADFVFEPDYELMPLTELEAFVKENRHLPNVPSAEEFINDGVRVTWMQMRLLEKIEELTLHTIDQHKTIESLQARLAAIEAQQPE